MNSDYFAILVQPCTQVEAEAGSNNTKPMTPLRAKQQFDELISTKVVVDTPQSNLFLGGAGNETYSTLAGCIFVGPGAGLAADTCNDSIGIGSQCMEKTESGVGNTAIGRLCLYENVSGGNNTAVGDSALRDCVTDLNTGVGYITMQAVTTGTLNTGVGAGVALVLTTGSHNTLVGANSMIDSVIGNRNCTLGVYTLYEATTDDNVAVGWQALYSATHPGNSTGENTGVGANAGFTITTGFRNTFIGANSGNNASQLVSAQNSTAIGNGTFTTANNQVVIGNTDVTSTILRGSVTTDGLFTCRTAVSTWPAGGGQAIAMGSTGALGVYAGTGAPTAAAGQGSLYMRLDGSSTSTRLYVNTDGGTTWTSVTTAS